jgi:hypothetical protein
MKNTFRSLSNYVLPTFVLHGFLIAALLIGLKVLSEHTFVGHRPELLTFSLLKSVFTPFTRHEELPVVVVDVSEIKETNGQITDLAKLTEITAAIADHRPSAIGIALILNPKDVSDPKLPEPTVEQAQEYYKFLDFCLRLREEKNVPIFLGVGMMSGGKPEEWLGQEKYKELAASALADDYDSARIPVWFKAGPTGEKLFSLSVSLSRAHTKSQFPAGLSWAVKSTGEELPARQRPLAEGIELADALINYGTLEEIRRGTLSTRSQSSVNEAGEEFRDKMVLIGDGKKAVEVFTPPGETKSLSRVYMHAPAAYTFAREPLYELKQPVRFAADLCFSLLVFGGIALTRHRRVNTDGAPRAQQYRNVFIHVAAAGVVLGAAVGVYWLGLLWLDFVLVGVAVWLQPKFEKRVKSLAINQPPNSHKRKILFIAANPSDASRIQTDREHRIIKAEMQRGTHRDAFEFLQPQFAVTITELLRAMNAKPNIVHFSGHGETDGIVIATDDNEGQLLTADILEQLFKPLRGVAEMIVLNSCYSAAQAEIISRLGMYVVGNNLPVGDQAAISFAKGLYNGLGEGKSFADAINDARIVLMTESPDYSTIVEVWEGGNKLHI